MKVNGLFIYNTFLEIIIIMVNDNGNALICRSLIKERHIVYGGAILKVFENASVVDIEKRQDWITSQIK